LVATDGEVLLDGVRVKALAFDHDEPVGVGGSSQFGEGEDGGRLALLSELTGGSKCAKFLNGGVCAIAETAPVEHIEDRRHTYFSSFITQIIA
jgi:hypothetical protein